MTSNWGSQFKMHWVERAIMSCEGELILLCKIQCCVVFWLELYINLGLGLSWTEQPTSGNMWKVTEMFCVFVASSTFTLRWGLLSMLSRAVLYSWLMISTLVGLLERTGFWHWSLSPLKLNQWWCWYHITCSIGCCRWREQHCADAWNVWPDILFS